MKVGKFTSAVQEAASAWRDPDYTPREDAVEQTLAAPNRFTEEALAYALNQGMQTLLDEDLPAWTAELAERRFGDARRTVAFVGSGRTPLDGLREVLGALPLGHAVRFVPAASSPALLPTFFEDVSGRLSEDLPWRVCASAGEAVQEAAAVVAWEGGDEEDGDEWAEPCRAAGIPASRRYVHPARFSIAVLDGSESADALEGLAADALLYEGQGSGSVRLVWAPAGQPPDAVLEALAQFRGAVSVHPETPGALEMQRAFLDAADQSHAYGEGLEFLLSRGAPDVQPPGHLRWVEYDDPQAMHAWIEAEAERLQQVIARPQVAQHLPEGVPTLPPGAAHRWSLRNRDARPDAIDFLAGL